MKGEIRTWGCGALTFVVLAPCFAEPAGQLLQVQGSTATEVAVSLERVLRTLRITSTEHKVKT